MSDVLKVQSDAQIIAARNELRALLFMAESVGPKVLQFLETGAAASVPTIQVWILELFVRGCFVIDHKTKCGQLDEIVADRFNQ
jgi:hypothetical protein